MFTPTVMCLSFLLLIVFVSDISGKSFQCDLNEEYTTCGLACPHVCGVESSGACPPICRVGCYCRKGFIRSTEGSCISEIECQRRLESSNKECPPHSTYETCGSSCPEICGSPKLSICSTVCVSGCFCNEGYVRNNKGDQFRCIPRSECQQAA